MARINVNVAAAAAGGGVVSLHVHLGHARVLLHKGLHLAVERGGGPRAGAEALLGAALGPCIDEAVALKGVVALNMLGHLPEGVRGRTLGAAAQEGGHGCVWLCKGKGFRVAIEV